MYIFGQFYNIAILCNSRKRVALVAEYLSASDIPVFSNEGLLLKNSEKVNLIISCFMYLQDSDNIIARTAIINYLYEEDLLDKSIHDLNTILKTESAFLEILQSINIVLNKKRILGYSVYEMTEYLIRIFNVKE